LSPDKKGGSVSAPPSPRPDASTFGAGRPNLWTLDPESVEAVARRVAELLTGDSATGLVDAAELARLMGVSRDHVYRHAAALGAVRLGTGPRARLRFDPMTARSAGEGSVAGEVPAPSAKPRGRSRPPNGHNPELLPIGPRRGGRRDAW